MSRIFQRIRRIKQGMSLQINACAADPPAKAFRPASRQVAIRALPAM
jgi:hypothetical protein